MRVATKSPHRPRVSVIIPTYNRPRLLQEAVESALAQTYRNVEIIVVDDGSTDNTAEIVAQYGGKVTYIKQANQDVAIARNTGIRAASGEYLTFLDDDDIILPTKIARQVEALASQPEADLVHCRFYYADKEGKRVYKVGLLPEGEVLPRLLTSNFVWVGAPLVRRRCLDQVGLFDEQIPPITADWDMWLRIAQAGYKFACAQEPLGVYRIHEDGMMSDVAELERGITIVLEKAFSNSHLSVAARALEEQTFEGVRFFLSCRYYVAGQWENAQRNLSEALVLNPDLLAHPTTLAQRFVSDALGPRVRDPLEFVANVLDHLPPCVNGFQRYRHQLLGRIHAELALRSYADGNIAYAKNQFTEAIALDPKICEQTDAFARSLLHYALHLPISTPIPYVHTVFQNLPAQAQRLRCVQAHVLSNVYASCGIQDYRAGHRASAVRQTLTALRHRPSPKKIQLFVSILLKSLRESTAERRTLRWISRPANPSTEQHAHGPGPTLPGS